MHHQDHQSTLSPSKGAALQDPHPSTSSGCLLFRGELTGIILAGGASRRMGGRNKAFLELDSRPLIEVVIERMIRVSAEVLIVAGDTSPYTSLGVPVIADRFRGVGVLGGLHAGLEAASYELTLAVGCDMPFLNPDLLRVFAAWAEGFDAVVLRHELAPPGPAGRPPRSPSAPLRTSAGRSEGRLYVEPLHAAYRRTCLPALESAIRAGERRIVSFFPHVRVRYVTLAEVAPFDPDLRSFRNVNTPEEWEAVQAEWAASALTDQAIASRI
jgi:molybdopterin-guanine dinucleotide biosynthesis protein A